MEALGEQPIVGPFNLGSDGRITIGELAAMAVKVSGREVPIEFDRGKEPVLWGQACDCSLAFGLLGGWRSTTSLEEGMREVADDIRQRLDSGEE